MKRISTVICEALVRNQYVPGQYQVAVTLADMAPNGVTCLGRTTERFPADRGVSMDEAREIERDALAAHAKGWR